MKKDKTKVFFRKEVLKKIFITNFSTNLYDIWKRTWVYKLYDFFRYKLYNFIKNIWIFRKPLWEFRWWDYSFTLALMRTALKEMGDGLKKYGIEVEESRNKKINKIGRVVELMDKKLNDTYLERAERELGEISEYSFDFEEREDGLYEMLDKRSDVEKEHDSKVFDYARELEKKEWEELWEILKGKPVNEWKRISKKISLKEDNPNLNESYEDWFDGSDMRGWWD